MKRLRVFWSMLLMLCTMWANAQDCDLKLSTTIAKCNKMCPISLGVMGEMTSMTYEHGNVLIRYDVNENVVGIDQLDNNREMVKQNAITMFSSSDGDMRAILEMLAAKNAGLVMKYVGKQTRKTFTISFEAKELMAALQDPEGSVDLMDALNFQVEMANKMFPLKISEGLVMSKASIEGQYIVYEVLVDESKFSIVSMANSRDEMKKGMIVALRGGDPSSVALKDLCRKANVGIIYRYTGKDSGKYFTLRIETFEM